MFQGREELVEVMAGKTVVESGDISRRLGTYVGRLCGGSIVAACKGGSAAFRGFPSLRFPSLSKRPAPGIPSRLVSSFPAGPRTYTRGLLGTRYVIRYLGQ